MTERRLRGIAASPGLRTGVIVHWRPLAPGPSVAETLSERGIEEEPARLRQAIEIVRQRISAARHAAARASETSEAAIFDAHELMLDDPALTGEAERRIRDQRTPAALAVRETADELRQMFEELDDPYLRERAADVEDVARQIVRALSRGVHDSPEIPEDAIVVAEELYPSDTALLPVDRVAGIATARGSRSAHVAILARGIGLPAVVGLSDVVEMAKDGESAVIDGDAGELILSPEPEVLSAVHLREKSVRLTPEATPELPAITSDEVRVNLLANIGHPNEAETALRYGAEGIGLFRTEFLFHGRPALPDEEEQYDAYRQVAAVMGSRPVVIRTLDAGGDKPLPGIATPRENNPFLGTRGVRLSLREEALFRVQLRAILRAATAGNLRIMFPMVATLDDIRDARRVLDDVVAELQSSGTSHRSNLPVGTMIEVPAAAIAADRLAAEVDFFSIGTNDLAQYTLAIDRTDDRLAARYDPFDVAVLRLIELTVEAANAAGKPVAICGEAASDSEILPTLIGLGLRELSMAAPAIPRAKGLIRSLAASDSAAAARLRLGRDDHAR